MSLQASGADRPDLSPTGGGRLRPYFFAFFSMSVARAMNTFA